jgi:hypothetical protein
MKTVTGTHLSLTCAFTDGRVFSCKLVDLEVDWPS